MNGRMDFPIGELLDQQACHDFLLSSLHPGGLRCPNGHGPEHYYVHRRGRAPVLNHRCRACGSCFNLFTGTVLQGTHYDCGQIVQLLRGILQGASTARLARETGRDRRHLLERRRRLQALAEAARPRAPLPDPVVESDEMYQNAGEKRRAASRPGRPAAPPGQQDQGTRNLRQRPAARAGRGRA
jgi:transposase-like protein